MNILDKIIEHKKEEVGLNKKIISSEQLKEQPNFDRPVFSLKQFLLDENQNRNHC